MSALHAFEVFEEIAPATAPGAMRLCDWLGSITLPDDGLPFGLPITDPAGCAPFFVAVDPDRSSEFRFALQFLDAVHDLVPGADAELRRLGGFLPPSGSIPVEGGAADEAMRPLDFAPDPHRPIRRPFSPAAILKIPRTNNRS